MLKSRQMELDGLQKWSCPVSLHSCRSPLFSMMITHLHHPPSPSLESAASSSMAYDDLSVSRMSLSSPGSTLEAEASAQTICSRDLSPSPIPESSAPLPSHTPHPQAQGDIIEMLRIQVGIEHRQRPTSCKGDKPLPHSAFCTPFRHPQPTPHPRASKACTGNSQGFTVSPSPSPAPPGFSSPHSTSVFCSSRESPPSGANSGPEPASVYSTARIPLVGFLHELSGDFHLQQETLFASVGLMDQYLAEATASPPPLEILQLVALACIFINAKREETHPCQPTAADWIATTDSAFSIADLVRMEWFVLETFNYDLECPTAYSYLHLLCHALSTCSVSTICWATYLVELSLFDAQTQAHGHLQTAVAALLLAHLQSHSSASAISDAINALVQVDREVVRCCASRLVQLHSSASAAPSIYRANAASKSYSTPAGQPTLYGTGWAGAVSAEQADAVLPVRKKFSRAEWMCVALYPLSLPR